MVPHREQSRTTPFYNCSLARAPAELTQRDRPLPVENRFRQRLEPCNPRAALSEQGPGESLRRPSLQFIPVLTPKLRFYTLMGIITYVYS